VTNSSLRFGLRRQILLGLAFTLLLSLAMQAPPPRPLDPP